jgi:hypothetical protein
MQLVSLKKIDSTDARNIGELEGGAKTSCASCHIEHRGETFDLTAMSDARCQACHAQQFQSLAQGHPQFDNYPYRSQRRIAFDHRAHHDKHFGTKGESFDCTSCHVDKTRTGQVGSVFRSVDFAQACARCHEQAIASETINGWALLQVPSIEAADSHDSSLGLTDWPTTAMFGYEAEFSIPLRILLAADPDAYDSLRKLPASGRLEDILLHSGDRAEVSRALALAFRRLVKDVAVSGQVAWKERLVVVAERALQRQLNPLELSLIAELSSGLPPDLFRHIETAWFGKQSTLADSSVEKPPFRMVVQSAQDDLLLSAEDDGLLDNSLSQSDLVEDGLLEQNSIASESPASGASATILTQLRGATHVAAGGWYLDPELLALCYMPQGHADRTLAAWEEYICLIQSGHAQTAPGDMPGDLPDDLPGELDWQRLTHGQSLPGSCTQCHLLEAGAEPAAGQSVWQSLARPESVRPFTRFDHTPHLTLPALSDCRYCHRFDSGSPQTLATAWEDPLGPGGDDSAGAYHSLNRLTREHLSHEFESMQRSQCVACHRPGGASDGCTQCHHYHVGNPGFDWSQN